MDKFVVKKPARAIDEDAASSSSAASTRDDDKVDKSIFWTTVCAAQVKMEGW